MNSIEARPTEYRGVTFRSKSEAIVARAFDLLGASWFYEPNVESVTDWAPDFWVSWPWKSKPGFTTLLLEYKPFHTTAQYRHELGQRFEKLRSPWIIPALLVCDPFCDHKPAYLDQWVNGSWKHLDHTVGMVYTLTRTIWNARYHRFDLKEELALA